MIGAVVRQHRLRLGSAYGLTVLAHLSGQLYPLVTAFAINGVISGDLRPVLALAAWHSGLYVGVLPAPIVPCTENGPSCTGEAQMILGLPIPYLSAVAFAAILACLLLPKGHRP